MMKSWEITANITKMMFHKSFRNSLRDQISIMSKCKCGTSWVNKEPVKYLKKNKALLKSKELMKKKTKTRVKLAKTSQSFKILKRTQKMLVLNNQGQNYSATAMKVLKSIRK